MTHRILTLFLVVLYLAPGAFSQDLGATAPTAPFGLGDASLFSPANPWSQAAEDLGRALFLDPILSSDRTRSCSSCHQANHGFASPEPFPPGAEGKRAARHAPTLFNRAFGQFQMWDGREETLEKQVLGPIKNPLEMNLKLPEAVSRLATHKLYPRLFQRAFGDAPLTSNNLARALAVYVRTLTIGNSPVDRFQAGQGNDLTPSEKAGLWIYESRGRCWQCHSGPNFTDERFHNTGIGSKKGVPEIGRGAVTRSDVDRGRFKTPTLRGAALSAPFMHDGSLSTLEDVVRFYSEGGRPNSHLSRHIRPLHLTESEQANLVAFLRALSRE